MHHAIMDHSSIPLLLKDVLAFITSVHSRSVPHSRSLWRTVSASTNLRQELSGLHGSKAPLLSFLKFGQGHVPDVSTGKVTQDISFSQISAEISLAHVPSFLEAAWALTAAIYRSNESVVFGLVLSGRSPAPCGIQTTLGPTIADVPVQVNLRRGMTVEGILKERSAALRELQTGPALQYGTIRIREVSDAAGVASRFRTLLNVRLSANPREFSDITYDHTDETVNSA